MRVVAFPFSRDLHMRKAVKELVIVAGILGFIAITIGTIRLAAPGLNTHVSDNRGYH
jgi:hypothetical protein